MATQDWHPYPLQRVIPTPDGLRIDEQTEIHEANRVFKDLKVLIRTVVPRSLPSRPPKVITDTSTLLRKEVTAKNAVDWQRLRARLETRPLDCRRQHQLSVQIAELEEQLTLK
jgi:hypothetical protein